MSNYNSENAYLFGHIKATLLECSFLKKGKHSESCRWSFLYTCYVKVNGIEVGICIDEFFSVHGLQNSWGWLQDIQKMITSGKGTIQFVDQGKHK